jgi:hypothetical protein
LNAFLADMCIFPRPITSVTKDFLLATSKKLIFYFISAQKGRNRWFFCEAATKGIVANSTSPIFTGGRHCRKAKSWVFGIMSAWSHILNYFLAKSI